MAKTKKTIEELNKKYGINGEKKTTPSNNEKGKQTTSASSAPSTSTKNNSKKTIEDLNKKYGVNGEKKTTWNTTNTGKSNIGATSASKKTPRLIDHMTARHEAIRSTIVNASEENKKRNAALSSVNPKHNATDYSSAVKYLNDKGVKGASGMMTEAEWRRRNRSGGTYQEYIDSFINKYGKGNIDLTDRPIYDNPDGTISTVASYTIGADDKYYVLPSIVRDKNGITTKLANDDEVFNHFKNTGEYLGVFDTQEEADNYARNLHISQEDYYKNNKMAVLNQRLESAKSKTTSEYLEKRYQEEINRIQREHANEISFPVAAHAMANVDEELKATKKEIEQIERQLKLYSHTSEITTKKDFAENSKYSPLVPKTDEELKAEGYTKNEEGQWRKYAGFFKGFETYTGEDSDLYTYINDERKRRGLETTALAKYGQNTYQSVGYHTLTEEEKGAFNYLYHQDRENGTETALAYLQAISPLLKQRAMEEEADRYASTAKDYPVASSVISLGTNAQNAMMFPAKVAATAMGYYEDAPELDMFGNRTQAIRGAVSEDMGTVGRLAYNAGMSIGDMGVAMLVGGGNAKVIQAIMSSSAGSSTISEAKKNGASDGKALMLGLGSAAIEWATEKYSVEAILKNPKTIRGYLLTNTFTEATEEGASNVSNVALDAIVSEVFGEKNDIEQRIDYLVANAGKTEEEALQIAFLEKLQSLGEDVLVGGLTGFGMSSTVASPAIVEKGIDRILNKPIKEGDAQTDSAPTSLEQAAMELIESRNATQTAENEDELEFVNKGEDLPSKERNKPKTGNNLVFEVEQEETPTYKTLEARSRNNEPITVDEAKKVTGFGDSGSVLVAKLANTDGVTFSQAESAVETAYLAGYKGVDRSQARFVTHTQKLAFEAGIEDRRADNRTAQAKAGNATIYDGVFTENEFTKKNFSKADRRMISTVAKALAMDISTIDKIIASEMVVNGRKIVFEANAKHVDGEMVISETADHVANRVVYKLIMHEGGHRMRQLAPDAFGSLMNALYTRAERIATKSGDSRNARFNDVRDQHLNAGITMNTGGYMEEVAVRELENIFGSAREFNKWYAEISGNPQVRTNFEKFVDWVLDVIDDIKRALKQAKMTKAERAEANAELDRIKGLLANAYKASEQAVQDRRNNKSVETKSDTSTEVENEDGLEFVNADTDLPTQEEKSFKTYRMDSILGDGERTVGTADGQAFVTNSKDILPSSANRSVFLAVDNAKAAKAEFGATESNKTSANISKILASDFAPIRKGFVDGTLKGVGEVRVFTDENGREIAIETNVAEYFEGYNLEATFRGGKPYAIKATDSDGKVVGVAMAVWMDRSGQKYEITDAKEVSTKSFNSESKDEGVTNLIDEDMHIDNRTWEGVGDRSVKAFQFLFPEFKEYYTPLAQELLGDLDNTIKGERIVVGTYEMGNREFSGVKRLTSDAIAKIKDVTNASYDDIRNALNRIINDEGQENIALAKRIELVLDEMLTDGYNTFDGLQIPPNEEYIAKKEALLGKTTDNNNASNSDDAWEWMFDTNFSLKNKNLTINSLIPYVELKNYISVAKGDYSALSTLEKEVGKLKKGTYQNEATGYRASITKETVDKAIRPTHKKFNRFKKSHIRNLNAILRLPELFKNAVYVDSKNPQKNKNQNKAIKEFHHFVAPIFMDGGEFRALITAREKINSNTLYVLRVEVLPTQKRHTPVATQHNNAGGSQLLSVPSDISIPELVNGVKIYNYDTQTEDTYTSADIQFSLKDNDYLKAVKNGDMKTAQKLVEEAAKEAGYIGTYYHGSKSDFTVFKKEFGGASNSNAGIGFWFTETEEGAKAWTDNAWWGDNEKGKVYKTYLRLNNPKVYETVDTKAQRDELKKGYEGIDKEMSLYDSIYHFEDGRRYHTERFDYDTSKRRSASYPAWSAFEAIVKNLNSKRVSPTGSISSFAKWFEDEVDYYLSKVPEEERQTVQKDAERYFELSQERKALEKQITELRYYDAYELFRTDMYKQIGLGAEDANIGGTGKYVENKDEMLKKYVDMLKQGGYDGIVIKNTSYDAETFGDHNNQYLVFDSNQVKSAESVTYDDNGNVIPLSERFNTKNDDIRYSLKDSDGNTLTKEQQEYFKDSKIRDKDGNLLVMYHGTTRGGFTVFDGGKDYWYFTNDKKYSYAFEGRKKNGQFYPYTKERMEKGEATPQRYKVYLNVTNPYIADIDTVEDALYWDKSLAGLLREKGYDALMVEDMSQVIVLNANQIKNTTNKNPSGSDDIRHSLKGSMSATEFYDTVDAAKKGKKKAIDKLSKYVDSGAMSTERYQELIGKYGAIPTGERPHRDIQVPAKTGKNKKVSQTVRTVLEAEVTPDEAVPTIEKMVEDGIFSYDVYTDKQAIADSEAYIKEYGWDESLDDWFDAVEKGEVSKELTTMGWALYNNAANLAATTTSETERTSAIKTSLKILDAMVRHQRSAAQALQATRILKKLSPETQLYGIQKSVHAFQNELTEKYGDKAPDLKIDDDLAEQFINAKTDEERAEIEEKIYKDIGRQMPSRFIDKWNAWRYLAMLGNVRTHVRNVGGNAFFAPVVGAKNLTATAIESIVYRVSGKKMLRGKALITGNKADRALLKAAWGDYANVADLVSNGGKYNDSAMKNQQIEEGRRIFKFKPLEWARKGNSKLLEMEDMWFSKPHYAYALAQYCKANNITAEQIKRGKAIAPARDYAIKEAQKATYRDTNAFSQFVSSLGRGGEIKHVPKVVSMVVEGILPFRKTPANILVRGVEYSPLGLLKGLADIRNIGKEVGKGKNKRVLTATEVIDNISAGLTGTGLLALGVYLAAQGLIRGHGEDEEEERKFNELTGHQSYSLELPNGQSITLDWLAPEVLPFFVGVNIWETTKGTDEEVTMSSILNALKGITEPMVEMSCLQGVNDLIDGIGYASSNDMSALMAILTSAATSYLMQGLPTLFGQAERTGEEERMTTYTEKNSFLTGDMQYTLGKASAKIPFWDYNQIPYIDAWGRKEASGNALKRGLNNFLNPAYTSTVDTSKMEKELLRLYEQTGEGGVFPERADKYFTVGGVRKDLTADEYVRYATLKGEKSYDLVSDLVNSTAYKKLSDEEKVKAIKETYDYANQKAKQAISRYKPDKWVSKADEFGSNVGNYISFKTEVSGTKEENGGKISKSEVVDIILDMAQNDSETWKMYLSMYDGEDDIKAEKYGIDAETFMTATVDMGNIQADYIYNGRRVDGKDLTKEQKKKAKTVNGSRKAKIVKYLNSNCSTEKDYMYLLGTEYDSVLDDYDYVKYFGKE